MEEYLQETKIENIDEKEKEIELIKNIIKTRRALKNADKNFEYAQDDLVDYYIYEMKANEANGKDEGYYSGYYKWYKI